MINTTVTAPLPKDWTKGEDLELYFRELRVALDTMFQRVYMDFLNGTMQFKVVTNVPTVEDIDESEIAMYVTGTTITFYSKVNGVIVSK